MPLSCETPCSCPKHVEIFMIIYHNCCIKLVPLVIFILCMNLGTTRLRGRPRNRWQGGVREDGRIVGGEGWQEKVRNREKESMV